jgi:phosphate/sulfate permease
MRTLGRRIFPLRPVHGFVAEAIALSVLDLTAFVIAAPISTTQIMRASVTGVGATGGSGRSDGALLARSGWPGCSRCPRPQRSPLSRIHWEGSKLTASLMVAAPCLDRPQSAGLIATSESRCRETCQHFLEEL